MKQMKSIIYGKFSQGSSREESWRQRYRKSNIKLKQDWITISTSQWSLWKYPHKVITIYLKNWWVMLCLQLLICNTTISTECLYTMSLYRLNISATGWTNCHKSTNSSLNIHNIMLKKSVIYVIVTNEWFLWHPSSLIAPPNTRNHQGISEFVMWWINKNNIRLKIQQQITK